MTTYCWCALGSHTGGTRSTGSTSASLTTLGSRCAGVEAIDVVGETPYTDLPAAARERLGIGPTQKNVLLRIVIRDLERTLTTAEANALRDEIYPV